MKVGKKKYIIHTKYGEFLARIWHDARDNAYLVLVPSLPSTCTFGKTLVEAKKMARDAIELTCSCAIDEGKVIIDDTRKLIGKLPVSRIVTFA